MGTARKAVQSIHCPICGNLCDAREEASGSIRYRCGKCRMVAVRRKISRRKGSLEIISSGDRYKN